MRNKTVNELSKVVDVEGVNNREEFKVHRTIN